MTGPHPVTNSKEKRKRESAPALGEVAVLCRWQGYTSETRDVNSNNKQGGGGAPVPRTTGPRAFSSVRTLRWSGSAQEWGDRDVLCGNPQCSWLPAGSNKSFFLSGGKKREKNGEINPCDPRHEHQNVRRFRNTGDADQGPPFPREDRRHFTGNTKPLGGLVSVEHYTITCSLTHTHFEDIFNQTV